MDVVWFILFSTIEVMSYCILMLCFFRFEYRRYILEIVLSCILFSVLSYAMRIGLDLSDFFPIVNIVFYSFFAFSVLRVPPIWSIIMSRTTIIAFFIVQTLLMVLLIAVGAITMEGVENYQSDAYILQAATALVVFIASVYLYNKGYGFTFSFNKFRWRSENTWMLALMFVTYGLFLVLFFQKDVFYGIIVETVLFAFLMLLSIRKERADL